jgi:hypothetical protein
MSGINQLETGISEQPALDPDIYFAPKGDRVGDHREFEIPDELIPEFMEDSGLFREQHPDLFYSS